MYDIFSLKIKYKSVQPYKMGNPKLIDKKKGRYFIVRKDKYSRIHLLFRNPKKEILIK